MNQQTPEIEATPEVPTTRASRERRRATTARWQLAEHRMRVATREHQARQGQKARAARLKTAKADAVKRKLEVKATKVAEWEARLAARES